MNWLKCLVFGVAWLGLYCSENVRAGFVMQFADANGSLVTQYPTIEVGQTVDIYVYLLQETGTTLLTDEGIFSVVFHVDYSDQTIAQVLTKEEILPNSLLSPGNNSTLVDGSAIVDLASDGNPGSNFGTPQEPNRMFLTKLHVTGLSVGTMQFSFRDLEGDGFLTLDSNDFDRAVDFSATATLNVVATPEPSSVLLMLVGSGLVAPRLFRRVSSKGRGLGSHTT